MKRKLLVLLAAAVLGGQASAQKNTGRVPYKMFDDFETGELYAWETYPYAQDIAFDALYYASKNPTYKNSKYSLARPFKAHDVNELYQGFTKRLDLYTTPDTRLKAAVYFQGDRDPEALELSLGTFEGERYFHKISKPKANTWLELDIPMSSFTAAGKALKAGEHIQVVTLKGSYPIVNYLYTYTVLMDDFQLNGERDGMFTASAPQSESFENFGVSILKKHFFSGDNISLTVKPDAGVTLQQVKGTLLDGKGKIVRDNIPFTASGGQWQNNAIYKVSDKDERGQWELRLTGTDGSSARVATTFKFLVPVKRIDSHPRLFFSADELKNRLANERSPVAKGILEKALEKTDFMKVDVDAIKQGTDRTAENLIGGPYSRTSVGFNAYGEWYNPNVALGNVIKEGSFRYAFTGDKAAGEQAKKALLKLCSFTKWNADWMLERKFWTYYPVGYTIKPVALGYDMLYDLLTEQERTFVRNAIMDKGLKLFHRDMVEMNRMPSQQTNHIAVIVAGFGLAATAIYGDDPSNPNLEPYLSGIMTKAKAFIDKTYYEDGSYAEPKSGYMDMATRDIVEILATFERNFGVDYSTTTNAQNFYKYPLHASFDSGLMQSYGDGGRAYSGFTQDHAWWFVHRNKNPYLYKYVKPYWEAGNGGYLSYLWFRDDITPESRESLPLSKVFSAQGMVMRSGWDDKSTVVTTRVGPNNNHAHYDQGSFQIMTNGEELLTDPGIGALGYYANLEFLSYDVQAIAHNVMLVDHDPESQNPAHYDNGIKSLRDWPRMKHTFTSSSTDAVESDLTSVYKDKLEKYNRTLLFSKNGPVFLFDEVKSKTGGHVYDWLFHTPQNEGNKRSVALSGNRMTVDRPKARLTMDVISSDVSGRPTQGLDLYTVALENSSASIRDRADKKFAESFVTLVSKPDLEQANFFAVLLPEAKPEQGDFGARPVTTAVNAEGWAGARIEHGAGTDIGFFRLSGNADKADGFLTDARRLVTSYDSSRKLRNIYLEGSTLSGGDISFKTSAPATAAISFTDGVSGVELQAAGAGSATISMARKPSGVSINGKSSSGWSYNAKAKSLVIKYEPGQSQINITR